MSTDYAARVAKGAALLDAKRPGWERELNLDRLDIENGSCCVTAQISGMKRGVDSWLDGMEQLKLTSGDAGSYVAHGFNAASCADDCAGGDGCRQSGDYATLNALWREVITERLTVAQEG